MAKRTDVKKVLIIAFIHTIIGVGVTFIGRFKT